MNEIRVLGPRSKLWGFHAYLATHPSTQNKEMNSGEGQRKETDYVARTQHGKKVPEKLIVRMT
jgi:hypothetical protein